MTRAGPLAPVRVTVTQAAEGSLSPALFGIGTVEARRAYLIGPTVAGRVRQVAVDVGDRVAAGQWLAEMDPVDLDERQAALDASIARAGSAIAAAQAAREDARARQELAAAEARRYEELAAKDFISAGAVEARLQARSSADAAVASADANLAAARQDLQRLQAERAGLQQQRDAVRLLAPADGVVISREAEPGSTVVAGQAVLRLIDPASLWLRVRLDQGRSAGLAAGLRASIVLRSNPSAPLPGRVARVEATSDSVTEERVAMVAFDAAPAGLSAGELAEVTLALPATPRTLLLPNQS
jgi:HlyD family secretion protein